MQPWASLRISAQSPHSALRPSPLHTDWLTCLPPTLWVPQNFSTALPNWWSSPPTNAVAENLVGCFVTATIQRFFLMAKAATPAWYFTFYLHDVRRFSPTLFQLFSQVGVLQRSCSSILGNNQMATAVFSFQGSCGQTGDNVAAITSWVSSTRGAS